MQMRRHKWNYQASMIGMSWISSGELAAVLQNGLVMIFSLTDEAPAEVALRLPPGQQVAACEFSGRSLVFRTTSTNELFAVADVGIAKPEVRPLASLRMLPSVAITAMICLSNAIKDTRVRDVFVALPITHAHHETRATRPLLERPPAAPPRLPIIRLVPLRSTLQRPHPPRLCPNYPSCAVAEHASRARFCGAGAANDLAART